MTFFDYATILAFSVLAASNLFLVLSGEEPSFYTVWEVRTINATRIALVLVSLGIITLIITNA